MGGMTLILRTASSCSAPQTLPQSSGPVPPAPATDAWTYSVDVWPARQPANSKGTSLSCLFLVPSRPFPFALLPSSSRRLDLFRSLREGSQGP